MTDPFDVVWSSTAIADWQRLRFAEAEAVAVAVGRFAETGDGTVIAGEGGVFLLFVGHVAIELLIDGTTIHVWRVRQA